MAAARVSQIPEVSEKQQMKDVRARLNSALKLGSKYQYLNGGHPANIICCRLYCDLADNLIADEKIPKACQQPLDLVAATLQGCVSYVDVTQLQRQGALAPHLTFRELLDQCNQLPGFDTFALQHLQTAFQAILQLPQQQKVVVASKSFLQLAFEKASTREVQSRLQACEEDVVAELLEELDAIRGPEAMKHIEGHRLIEVIFVRLPKEAADQPSELAALMLRTMRGQEAELAKNKYACRVMKAMIRNCKAELYPGKAEVVEALIAAVDDLVSDSFGAIVIQEILVAGKCSEWNEHIARALEPRLCALAKEQYSSYVVEKLLSHCSADSQQRAIDKLLEDRSWTAATSGRFVAKAVAEVGEKLSRRDCKELQQLKTRPGNARTGSVIAMRRGGNS